MNSKNRNFNIGVDVGGTNIKFGIVDNEGKIISKYKIKTKVKIGSTQIIQSIIKNIKTLLSSSNLNISSISNIGIGFPGTTDSENGVVVFAPNLFWKNVEVTKSIESVFNVPVFIGQDSRAAAWGEFQVGAGKGYNHIACITLGTGIGCGLVLNRKIYHGGFLSSGEFGHQLLVANGEKCNCGRQGCLEAYASGTSIKKEFSSINNLQSITNKELSQITVMDVFGFAETGNEDALAIIDAFVENLGIGMVNLINLVSPELICISGGISNAPEYLLLNPLRKLISDRAYLPVSTKVKLVKSELGENAPLIGSSMLHLSN